MPENEKSRNIATFSIDSPGYAAFRPGYPPEMFSFLAGLAMEHALAWDAATGNGQAALALANHFQKVVANDLSAEQLGHAFEHPRVEYRLCPVEEVGLQEGSVDILTVGSALHWLDLGLFWPLAKKVLKLGGVFACFGQLVKPAGDELHAAVSAFMKEKIAPYQAASSKNFGPNFSKLDFPFKEVAAPNFDREEDWDLERYLGYLGTRSGMKRRHNETGEDVLADLKERLSPLWGEGKQQMDFTVNLRVGLNSPVWLRS